MRSDASTMTSGTASAIRPSLRDNRQLSGSPHTPSRFIPSNYSSPGSTFRQEEDAIIFELDPRCLKAGFEGESGPQCVIAFHPDQAKRVGDYRVYLPSYKKRQTRLEDAAHEYELWRNDLKDLELGLVEDKLERAVREAYNKYLLTDAGSARLIVVLPSLVPLPVLSTALTLLFERWRYTSITLLPAPTMCAIAAGLRSALVVDIGWEETVITPIYEYRELAALRSTRAMKALVMRVGELLKGVAEKQQGTGEDPLRHDFDFVEDFVGRCAFVSALDYPAGADLADQLDSMSVDRPQPPAPPNDLQIDWPSQNSSRPVTISGIELSQAVNDSFFRQQGETCPDDDEGSLDDLVYYSLLRLPPDVRALCMSRLIVVGPGGSIAGMESSLLGRVQNMVDKHGWSAVRGQHVSLHHQRVATTKGTRVEPADTKHNVPIPFGKDYVEEKVSKLKGKDLQQIRQGSLQLVDTLGAWTGSSLTSSLKVKGAVEIERERFLNHGLSSASRDLDMSVVPQRMSSLATGTTKSGDRTSWSLGNWG